MEVVTDAVVAGVVTGGVVVVSGVLVEVAPEGVVSAWVEAVVVPVGELPQATVKRSVARSATSRKSDVFFISNLSLMYKIDILFYIVASIAFLSRVIFERPTA